MSYYVTTLHIYFFIYIMLSLFKTLFVILLKPFGPQRGEYVWEFFMYMLYSPLLCYHLLLLIIMLP